MLIKLPWNRNFRNFFIPFLIFVVVAIFLMYVKENETEFFGHEKFRPEKCVPNNFKYSIEELKLNLVLWARLRNVSCRKSFDKFNRLFDVYVKEGKLFFDVKFANKMKMWLGNKEELLVELRSQNITHVYNKFSHKLTAYNSLRAKRPIMTGQNHGKSSIQKLINETRQSCDFCAPKILTAEEVFGRIEGKYSISAANAFKIDKWHGLFIPFKHSILDIKEIEFIDLFNTSLLWFQSVSLTDPSVHYPVLFWDMLPGAGASQVHVHIHGIIGDLFYHGSFKEQLSVSNAYFSKTGSLYWSDLIEVHHLLGLSVSFGDAVAFVPLTSQLEHELLLISKFPSIDLFRLLYFVIQMYHEIGYYCYSSGMAFPRLGSKGDTGWSESLPAIIRIGTRGDCPTVVNDVSSLQLNDVYTINVDPYYTIKKLKEIVQKLGGANDFGKILNLWKK